MLLNTEITIAFKCNYCGHFEFYNTSLFDTLHKKGKHLVCECGRSSINVVQVNASKCKITIPCIGCEQTHIFMILKKELLHKNLCILYCPYTRVNLCFIGNKNEVLSKIDDLEKSLDDEVTKECAYEDYFRNAKVMLEIINKIHDIAEKKNIMCECGCEDVEMLIFNDKVKLHCKKCDGSKEIYAQSNKDLNDFKGKKQIILFSQN